jgi:hypothetical protein
MSAAVRQGSCAIANRICCQAEKVKLYYSYSNQVLIQDLESTSKAPDVFNPLLPLLHCYGKGFWRQQGSTWDPAASICWQEYAKAGTNLSWALAGENF